MTMTISLMTLAFLGSVGGKPQGTNKVILREAEALGDVARSDRYASRDWWHSAITLPKSGVLRDIRSPVLAITSWATFLSPAR